MSRKDALIVFDRKTMCFLSLNINASFYADPFKRMLRITCLLVFGIASHHVHMQWSAKVLVSYVRELSKYARTEASRRNVRETFRTREGLSEEIKIRNDRWHHRFEKKMCRRPNTVDRKRDNRLFYTTGTTDIDLPLQSLVWRRSPSGLSSIILRRSRPKWTTSQDDYRRQQSSWAVDSKTQWGNSGRNSSKTAAGARLKCFPMDSTASPEKDGINKHFTS